MRRFEEEMLDKRNKNDFLGDKTVEDVQIMKEKLVAFSERFERDLVEKDKQIRKAMDPKWIEADLRKLESELDIIKAD
jgi:hypothetical protein